jgi:hypothetical protein
MLLCKKHKPAMRLAGFLPVRDSLILMIKRTHEAASQQVQT